MAKMSEVRVINASFKSDRPTMNCSACAAGHAQRARHTGYVSLPHPRHTLVAEISGPLAATNEGFRYVIVITELHTRYRVACHLRRKSDAEPALLRTVTAIARHFGHAPARVHVENTNKLLTKATLQFLERKGIAMEPMTPHTLQENSVAERKFRTIFGRVRASISAAQVPLARYWR